MRGSMQARTVAWATSKKRFWIGRLPVPGGTPRAQWMLTREITVAAAFACEGSNTWAEIRSRHRTLNSVRPAHLPSNISYSRAAE